MLGPKKLEFFLKLIFFLKHFLIFHCNVVPKIWGGGGGNFPKQTIHPCLMRFESWVKFFFFGQQVPPPRQKKSGKFLGFQPQEKYIFVGFSKGSGLLSPLYWGYGATGIPSIKCPIAKNRRPLLATGLGPWSITSPEFFFPLLQLFSLGGECL